MSPAIQAVLQVHTHYLYRGGEDQVVEAERRLLEEAGIRVSQVIFDNADAVERRSPRRNVGLAAAAIWSRAAQRRVRAAVARERPDVVHVHNTFFTASPSVFAGAGDVPVVHTLHNYRMVCPVATTFRDGHPCTDCVGRAVPWPGVVHACVHDSHLESAVAAATITVHRALGTFRRRIARYIALTGFQRDLMVAGGLPEERIDVVPNFLEPDPGPGERQRSGLLYVGRLVPEKGVEALLAAAAAQRALVRVAGDGPLKPVVESAAAAERSVEYLGRLEPPAVRDELARATALVLPSIWFEGFPLTVIEAYAVGTPVIASRIGSLAEVVEDGVTGLLAAPNDADDLAGRMLWALEHPDAMREMGCNARRRYEDRYRGSTHLAALLATYAAASSAVGGG